MVTQLVKPNSPANIEQYSELDISFSHEQSAVWFKMKGKKTPCFTPVLLHELDDLFTSISQKDNNYKSTQYVVAASAFPNVYNLGGDLDYFSECIKSSNKELLIEYAYKCIDLGYLCHRQFKNDITSIALVQGSALGGGFEAALSCNILIAEEQAKFGFPEINFNLFPGMGAFTYLSRRVSINKAEELIISGKQYSAEELFECGIVDVLAKKGEGQQATDNFINEHKEKQAARIAIQKAKSHIMPITLSELYEVADIWVEAALKVKPESLSTMKRLINAQRRKFSKVSYLQQKKLVN